ncbi:collagen Mcl1 protein [Rutstroemia sp. NJR-2017a BBW]|nr:collagen Mcl1 protein [Rutstroemia sp. NJR-2017a BBW]
MHLRSSTLFALLSPPLLTSASLLARQSSSANAELAYLDSVCSPNVTGSSTIPPCISITTIQTLCLPNGTSSSDFLSSAQCMCSGSFFSDWLGCLNCDYVHGGRSDAEVSAYHSIISTVSNELCTGTPTAAFAALFSSAGGEDVAVGGTGTDKYPSQTAVSLYYTYTGSGSQGPGVVTGTAGAATTSGTVSTGSPTGTSTTAAKTTSAGQTASKTSATAATGTGSPSSSTSSGGAAPTGVMRGVLGMVVGGMVMAAL